MTQQIYVLAVRVPQGIAEQIYTNREAALRAVQELEAREIEVDVRLETVH